MWSLQYSGFLFRKFKPIYLRLKIVMFRRIYFKVFIVTVGIYSVSFVVLLL